MAYVRPGDTLVVTELSRMTRSLLDLLETAKVLQQRGIELVSLRENIDTTTATGRCFLSMMGAIHQMERELRAERAAAGRASAKARGKTGGRPRTDAAKLENARILYENSEKTAAEVCEMVGVGRRTFFAYLARQREGGAHARRDPVRGACWKRLSWYEKGWTQRSLSLRQRQEVQAMLPKSGTSKDSTSGKRPFRGRSQSYPVAHVEI